MRYANVWSQTSGVRFFFASSSRRRHCSFFSFVPPFWISLIECLHDGACAAAIYVFYLRRQADELTTLELAATERLCALLMCVCSRSNRSNVCVPIPEKRDACCSERLGAHESTTDVAASWRSFCAGTPAGAEAHSVIAIDFLESARASNCRGDDERDHTQARQFIESIAYASEPSTTIIIKNNYISMMPPAKHKGDALKIVKWTFYSSYTF